MIKIVDRLSITAKIRGQTATDSVIAIFILTLMMTVLFSTLILFFDEQTDQAIKLSNSDASHTADQLKYGVLSSTENDGVHSNMGELSEICTVSFFDTESENPSACSYNTSAQLNEIAGYSRPVNIYISITNSENNNDPIEHDGVTFERGEPVDTTNAEQVKRTTRNVVFPASTFNSDSETENAPQSAAIEEYRLTVVMWTT